MLWQNDIFNAIPCFVYNFPLIHNFAGSSLKFCVINPIYQDTWCTGLLPVEIKYQGTIEIVNTDTSKRRGISHHKFPTDILGDPCLQKTIAVP